MFGIALEKKFQKRTKDVFQFINMQERNTNKKIREKGHESGSTQAGTTNL
jgi:hypothetical protein